MTKIFVHIGLPKTATTALQTHFFPSIDNNLIDYVGSFQPWRSVDVIQRTEFLNFQKAISNGNVGKFRAEIDAMLQNGRSLVISNEDVLVSDENADWRTRLVNLAALLKGYDYELILTVREPVSALHSYYIELYTKEFSREKKSFLELAKHDQRMEIFHYGKLLNEILNLFDAEHLFVKKFEEIISGDIVDLCELIAPGSDLFNDITLKNENFKKKSAKYVYTRNEFTATNMVSQFLKKAGISDIRLIKRLKKASKPLKLALNRIPVKRAKVVRPGLEEQKELRDYLREETQVLERLYGIKYV